MEEERSKGKQTEVVSIIIGVVVVVAIAIALWLPTFAKSRGPAPRSACVSNMKQLGTAMNMYAQDWDNHFPPAEKWNDALSPYIKNPDILYCPSEKSKEPSYAMNSKLSRLDMAAIEKPADTVTLFESKPGPNRFGGRELLPAEPRHADSYVIGFADGYAKECRKHEIRKLIWNPTTVQKPSAGP